MAAKTKLELTWIGKDNRPRLEPRILIEEPEFSHHASTRREGDIFDNMLIHGDNLLALKALETDPAVRGKVKCIFIDPPYNTGSAFAHYDDGLEHSLWLTMMKDRLAILQNLLDDGGSIWITVDDNEVHYLKVLCDEIFGRRNFLNNFIWQKSYGGGSKAKHFVGLHEHMLCYAKDFDKLEPFWLPPDPEAAKKYYKYKDEKFSTRGPYRLQPLATTSMDDRPNLTYAIKHPSGRDIWPEKQWQWSQSRVEAALESNEIVFTEKRGKTSVSYKQYLRDDSGEERGRKPTSIITGMYTQHGTSESTALFGLQDRFSFPKPEGLINYVLEACTSKGDLILDSFAGSGTTGAVAHKMGRRWIMVELGDHAKTHIVPRMRKVIDGTDSGGVTEASNWKGGGGYRFCRLAPSLLEKDAWGNWVIRKEYNSAMLAEAMCKHFGYTYAPSTEHYWMHGTSSETSFIYVTTNSLTFDQLRAISDEVGESRSLLICCTAYEAAGEGLPNLTLRKIPGAVLDSCEWGKDDYSLKISALPMMAEDEVDDIAAPKAKSKAAAVGDLFDGDAEA